MDDSKIDSIAREVLLTLKKANTDKTTSAHSHSHAPTQPAAGAAQHPSLGLLSVEGGVPGSPCIVEPDKVCIGSLRCRSFGH